MGKKKEGKEYRAVIGTEIAVASAAGTTATRVHIKILRTFVLKQKTLEQSYLLLSRSNSSPHMEYNNFSSSNSS